MNALLTELVLFRVLHKVLVIIKRRTGSKTYSIEILRVNEALVNTAADLLLQVWVVAVIVRRV
jgi:hypothetical protein